jgi:hypothetical protein
MLHLIREPRVLNRSRVSRGRRCVRKSTSSATLHARPSMPCYASGLGSFVGRSLRPAIAVAIIGYGLIIILASFMPADAYPRAVRKACKYDYKRLCPHYKVTSAKMRACMRSKVGQISPRCYDTLIRYGYGKRGSGRRRR